MKSSKPRSEIERAILSAALRKQATSSIDLHTHSLYSDGSLLPHELITLAAKVGLTAIALTDHDSTFGILEALDAGNKLGVEIIPGIELSSATESGEVLHILGYFIDYRDFRLNDALANQGKMRAQTHKDYIIRLNELGFTMTDEDVKDIAGFGRIGRAHYARVMMQKGYVNSVAEAFDKYLRVGGPAYLEREVMSPKEAIRLIHGAGGVACLAHPMLVGREFNDLKALINELKYIGLDGIEAYYSENSPEQQKWLLQVAEEFGLLVSGGSDFHAETKPHIELGSGVDGNLVIPYNLLEPIRKLHLQRKQSLPRWKK